MAVFLTVMLSMTAHPVAIQASPQGQPQTDEPASPVEPPEDSDSVSETNKVSSKPVKSVAPKRQRTRPIRKWVRERGVVYSEPDEEKLRADLYLPQGDGPFPGIVMIHGGGWRTGNRYQMSGHADFVANRGYVVMSIDYRLAPDHKWPAQIHDCKAAVRWLRINATKYKVDPDRIGSYGYSAGGHLAAMLGTTDPADGLEGTEAGGGDISTTISAVVAGGAPCDVRIVPPDSKFLYYWLGSTRRRGPEIYEAASPAAYVDSEDAPTFFYHGVDDWIVPVYSSTRMSRSLAEAGVTTRHFEIKGRGHVVSFMHGSAMRAAVEFLDQHLK
ncbi:MAG: alpha/beta hydrolase [Planctomycetota bacterium]